MKRPPPHPENASVQLNRAVTNQALPAFLGRRTEVKIDGEEHVLIREDDVLAVTDSAK